MTTQETRSCTSELAQTVEDLTRALATRPVIDQAIGILMQRNHCSADAGFDLLRQKSQNQNRKLREVATELVREVGKVEPTPPVFVLHARSSTDA
jgi:AmiR/NasT family two-component response regulator